jgi:hypothetical protein
MSRWGMLYFLPFFYLKNKKNPGCARPAVSGSNCQALMVFASGGVLITSNRHHYNRYLDGLIALLV